MSRPRLLLVASWVATTVLATLISAAGVSIVTRDVTDTHRPALRQAEVIALLAAPLPTVPPTAPTTETTVAPTIVAEPPVPETTAPPPTRPAPTTTRAPRPPAPTIPPLDDAEFATFGSRGGTVTVACLDDAIALVSSWPNDGYQMVVDDPGPDRIRVLFSAGDGADRDEVESRCVEGRPMSRSDGQGRRHGRGGDWYGSEDGSDYGGRGG